MLGAPYGPKPARLRYSPKKEKKDLRSALRSPDDRLLQDISHELRSTPARLSFAAELTKTAEDRLVPAARIQGAI